MTTTNITAEQVLAAQAAQFETFLGLARTTIDGVEKIAALNLSVAKTALDDAGAKGQSAFTAKDPQAFFASIQAEGFQPAAEKLAAYNRALYDIFAATGAEFGKVAEAQAADVQAKVLALVDTAAKNAPAGTENVVSLAKAAVSAANDALESVQKAAKQAVSVAESNIATLSSQVTKASAPAKGKRAAA